MKIIIQCASSKKPGAGTLTTSDGRPVTFVANVALAPRDNGKLYARPDDASDVPGMSWRLRLEELNSAGAASDSLLEAYRLYKPSVYAKLIAKFGLMNVFILSAGWGLIRANYRLPAYDITYSGAADGYKRRRMNDPYRDFNHVSTVGGPLIFFGGSDYLPLFDQLTRSGSGEKVVFYRSSTPPANKSWRTIKYETTQTTNWHYSCAKDLIRGTIRI